MLPLRRVGRHFGRTGLIVLVALLVTNLSALALPCADDLLVELGASPETCVATPPGDSGAPAPVLSVCPCACHMGFALSAATSVQPACFVASVLPQDPLDAPRDVARLIPHPPRV